MLAAADAVMLAAADAVMLAAADAVMFDLNSFKSLNLEVTKFSYMFCQNMNSILKCDRLLH